QWRRNGVPIVGATSSYLQINEVTITDAGDYTVVISNSAGAVTSRVARLVVYGVPPYFVVHPSSQDVLAGQSAVFYSSAAGSPAPAYQWFFNGTALPGANQYYLEFPTAQPNQAGQYYVVASNYAGAAISRTVTLSVRVAPPVFLQQPIGRTLLWGESF